MEIEVIVIGYLDNTIVACWQMPEFVTATRQGIGVEVDCFETLEVEQSELENLRNQLANQPVQ